MAAHNAWVGGGDPHDAMTKREKSPYEIAIILMAQLLPCGRGVWPVAVNQVSSKKLLVTARTQHITGSQCRHLYAPIVHSERLCLLNMPCGGKCLD